MCQQKNFNSVYSSFIHNNSKLKIIQMLSTEKYWINKLCGYIHLMEESNKKITNFLYTQQHE